MTGILALVFAVIGLFIPQTVSAQEVCVGDTCTINFDYTNNTQTWQVPAGVESLFVEMAAGQGGSSGGKGGFVSAWLTDLPSEIVINVGGMGASGSMSAGGFNGGGEAGGRYGSPGGGGGASDIRFGNDLSDRVLVAGGGGGFGGPTGGDGGDGGGEQAADGTAGQGGAGAGGTQLAGGAGGSTNGDGDNGVAGSLGSGGSGGYLNSGAGAGGGGGGYYGGGGGGADKDVCCLDAGGGGGGSSFADNRFASDVQHIQGENFGHGYITIRYSSPAEVTAFDFTQTGTDSGELVVEFDKAITGLGMDDFVITGCSDSSFEGWDDRYTVSISGCNETATAVLLADSAQAYGSVPKQDISLQIEFYQSGPEIVIAGPEVVSSSTARFSIANLGEVRTEYLEFNSCDANSTVSGGITEIELTNCPEGEVSFSVNRGFSVDGFGNIGPATSQTVRFFVDTLAPQISFGEPSVAVFLANGGEFSIAEIDLVSTDPIDFGEVVFSGDSQCLDVFSAQKDGFKLMAIGCPEGQITWTIPAYSQSDLVGNLGPATDVSVSVEIPEVAQPIIEPIIEQPTSEEPTTEQPTSSSPRPVNSTPEIVDDSQSTEETPESEESTRPSETDEGDAADEDILPPPTIDDGNTGVQTSSVNQDPSGENEASSSDAGVSETEQNDAVSQQLPPQTLVTQQQSPAEAIEESTTPWGRLSLAGLAVVGLLVGVIWLTKNNSARAIN